MFRTIVVGAVALGLAATGGCATSRTPPEEGGITMRARGATAGNVTTTRASKASRAAHDASPGAPPSSSAASPLVLPPVEHLPTDAAVAADVRAANAFGLALYARGARAPDGTRTTGNLCLSGTSVRHALAATYLGARGETAAELAKALGLASADAALALGSYEAAAWRKDKPESGDLVVATRLWVDDGVSLAAPFTQRVAAYGAAAEHLPIARDADAARSTVNAWVSERTSGKIPELLASGALDARTRLVVTNAVYMKARWAEPFPKAATRDEPFAVAGKTPTSVPMMHVETELRFAAADASKIVELRYDGTPLAMTLVVPDDPNGLARLEPSLSVDTLERWTKALAQRRVALAMPRFSFTSGGRLEDALRGLGVRTAFTDRADFGAMLASSDATRALHATGRLAIGAVVQRTFLAVDEVGTEAAAATGVVMRTTSLDVTTPVSVTADRPFLFFVRDVSRGRVLFVGRVDDPRGARS